MRPGADRHAPAQAAGGVGVTSDQNLVLDCIKQCADDAGISLTSIKSQLRGRCSDQGVKLATKFAERVSRVG